MNARLGSYLALAALAATGVVASCMATRGQAPSESASITTGSGEALRVEQPDDATTRAAEQPAAPDAGTDSAADQTAAADAAAFYTATEPPKAPQVYTVAAIGDSLTDERSYPKTYVAALRAACPKSRFDNYGVGGNMVNQMRRRFVREVFAPGRPAYTHVIVFGGINDIYSDETAKRTPAKITADLSEMYREASARGARVVALTIAPWAGFKRWYNPSRAAATHEVNRFIREALPNGQVDAVIDTGVLLSCGDPERLCDDLSAPFKDGLHFGAAGHARLAETLKTAVFSGCE
ncbi:MAG: hypothetical protein KF915_17125 [Polyangiaceae bacterium]|nr:hypothetical protein [Polyangiaceae bacterium]